MKAAKAAKAAQKPAAKRAGVMKRPTKSAPMMEETGPPAIAMSSPEEYIKRMRKKF